MRRLSALTSLLTLGVACGGPNYEKHVEPTFLRSCASVECHADAVVDPNEPGDNALDLSEGNGYAALVGVPSMQSDLDLVEPGNPDASYLWLKVTGEHADADNSATPTEAMPPVGSLTADQLSTIEDWILNDAP